MKHIFLTASLILSSHFLHAQLISQADTTNTAVPVIKVHTDSKAEKRNTVNNKAYVMQSSNYLNNVAKLDEGYTPFEGGTYAIKDYVIKGPVNLICLTYGVSLASGNINSGQSSKRYYLQKNDNTNVYREVFLTKKTKSAASPILLGGSQTYHGILNTKKSTGFMTDVSKAILIETMIDDADVSKAIKSSEKITVRMLKNVVKDYNSKNNVSNTP